MMQSLPLESMAIKGEVSIVGMCAVSWEEEHSVVVEVGEEAVGEANPNGILTGARRWAAFMPRTRWRWMCHRLY